MKFETGGMVMRHCRLWYIRICSASNADILPWHTKVQYFTLSRGYDQMFPRKVKEPPQVSINKLYPN